MWIVLFLINTAEGGTGGFGSGVTATMAELGGHIGKGPLGVGGKLGLSADSGVSFGQETGVKVLGTGVTFGSQGLSGCFLGSCFTIG